MTVSLPMFFATFPPAVGIEDTVQALVDAAAGWTGGTQVGVGDAGQLVVDFHARVAGEDLLVERCWCWLTWDGRLGLTTVAVEAPIDRVALSEQLHRNTCTLVGVESNPALDPSAVEQHLNFVLQHRVACRAAPEDEAPGPTNGGRTA